MSERSIYAEQWDAYVEWHSGDGWPGEEWGDERAWAGRFQQLFRGAESWRRAVEIGAGAGKYTSLVLAAGGSTVHAFDVSARFLAVLDERLRSDVEQGRVVTTLLDGIDPAQMLRSIEEAGWGREVDAVYSIDAMVHVDLQYLVAYLITAGLVLRPGGRLIMTVADATSEAGFAKLTDDIAVEFPRQTGGLTAKFEWLSPETVRFILDRLGFHIVFESRTRDFEFVAELASPATADGWRSRLTGS